ncbi:hypothetical protein CYMTET_32289 [Cymbomonas tetramitiformis]|uniref:C4-dicarboxylate transporter/malic acid transport protein n=1 Tax=Cymbomonas tetramitiformis TaxID=36881 RepID=A0AAE0KS32_9CHLO|nr:hypothetical protein CYMTET_32289 [Cymbomonas tetramitiformis]
MHLKGVDHLKPKALSGDDPPPSMLQNQKAVEAQSPDKMISDLTEDFLPQVDYRRLCSLGGPTMKLLKDRLRRTPPSIGGISLGCVGVAGALVHISRFFQLRFLYWLAAPFFCGSSCLLLVVALRIALVLDTAREELRLPEAVSAYAAAVVSLALNSSALARVLGNSEFFPVLFTLAAAGVWLAAVLQFAYMVYFFYRCWRTSTLPEPFWFPPTVSFAMTGWSGTSVHMDRTLVEITFWGGMLLCFSLLPIAMFRVLRYPTKVAPNPSVGILQAPASFMLVAWFAVGGSEWLEGETSRAVVACVLFFSSQGTFLITLVAVWQRRQHLRVFSPRFAGFTFPTASSVTGALLYWQSLGDPRSAELLASVWSAVMAFLTFPLVIVIIFVYLIHWIWLGWPEVVADPMRLAKTPVVSETPIEAFPEGESQGEGPAKIQAKSSRQLKASQFETV